MKTVKLFLITILMTAGALQLAKAQVAFHVSVGGGPYYYHRPYPPTVYCPPAPGYYGPVQEHVYYDNPAPVYYNSVPADEGCYGRRVIVYRRQAYYHPWYRGGYYHRAYYGPRFYRY